jgi:hypothetical protein
VAKWREDLSRPSGEDRWQRSRDLANSGVRRVKAQVLVFKVARREYAKREVARGSGAVHLRRTGGERSKDLANSGARRVRAQILGTPSHEDAR